MFAVVSYRNEFVIGFDVELNKTFISMKKYFHSKLINSIFCFVFSSKVNTTNAIELNPAFSSTTLHTTSSLQTITTETKDIYPMRVTFNGAYENPIMTTNDEVKQKHVSF